MNPASEEPTLDPANWDAFRSLAHEMVDRALDSVEHVRDRPAWQPYPDEGRTALQGPIPREGLGEDETYRRFARWIEPYTNGNRHPGFFGWVQGNGSPLAMMADMWAASMNPHCAGFDQSSTVVEQQVLDWLRELMGFPSTASGVFVSGGSMANFVGLAAARDAKAGWDVWREGFQGNRPRLVFYGSSEMHGWAPKAANLLGLGNDSFRALPVDEDFKLPIDALRNALEEDRAAGHQPFCVLASAGTVNTGATDDLDTLADLCRDEDVWFHIDAAYGAWARLSSTHADVVRGLERADSLAFDLHKWGYLPFEIACALIRDQEAHRRPFSIQGSYIQPAERGVFAGGIPFADRGMELTRNFKALKVWFSMVAHGVDRIAACIDENLKQAGQLARHIEADPDLEVTAPTPLNVVCFRAIDPNRSLEQLNDLNRELLYRVQESGRFVPSGTTLQGRFCLRVCHTNHRTRSSDITELARFVGDEARTLLAATRS